MFNFFNKKKEEFKMAKLDDILAEIESLSDEEKTELKTKLSNGDEKTTEAVAETTDAVEKEEASEEVAENVAEEVKEEAVENEKDTNAEIDYKKDIDELKSKFDNLLAEFGKLKEGVETKKLDEAKEKYGLTSKPVHEEEVKEYTDEDIKKLLG